MGRNATRGPIAHHQLAPWIKKLGPLTREQDTLFNVRFERRVARHALKHRLRGKLIHLSNPSGSDTGVTWHGYDKWLEENGARK